MMGALEEEQTCGYHAERGRRRWACWRWVCCVSFFNPLSHLPRFRAF